MSRRGRWVLVLAAAATTGLACSAAAEDAPPPEQPAVTFVGDSWTAGLGASGSDGFPALTAERLGWRYTVLGSPGSGYVMPGEDGPFGTRVGEAVAGAPDVLVLQGSVNDQAAVPEELAAAVSDTLARFREAADPDTEIVVLGASDTPGTDVAAIDRINAVLRAAAEAEGLAFVDVAAQNWSDPADPGIWADPLHPDDAGHERIADRLAPVLADVAGSRRPGGEPPVTD